jgi:CDP-diacylglycerol--glycerol-3-phosphate 3-phosphatidyltransferase
MTPATGLTVARLALAPVFVAFLMRGSAPSLWVAAGVFALAAVTDGADGWLARRTGTVTRVGRALDPLADKLLVALALVAFAVLRVPGVDAWMVAAIVGREVLVTLLRSTAGRRGATLPVSRLAKWKTTLQMGFVVAMLAAMSARAAVDPRPPFGPGERLHGPLRAVLLATTLVTVLSGLDYARRSRGVRAPARGGAA